MVLKIVSGGQTGVDRAALDAALDNNIDCGGWCPEGREAEDGVIPNKYPLQVLPGSGYHQRTRKNVLDSDASLIIYFNVPGGGTEQTIAFCIKEHKPYVLIDAEEFTIAEAAKKVASFLETNSIITLNVAGPRASGEPKAYGYARNLIDTVINNLK